MKMKTFKWVTSGVAVTALLSVVLVSAGEMETVLAWWLAVLLLLPGLLLALRSNFISLKLICLITFITQYVTVPSFFLSRDEFAWGHVKPFRFNAEEVLPILLKVGVFLLLLNLFFYALSRLSLFAKPQFRSSMVGIPSQAYWSADKFKKTSNRPWIYVGLLILLISVFIPLNLWMFTQGISIVGVEPPRLPYKISGILYYLTKFIFPILLGYLYYKTRHGLFPSMLLLGYGLILGLSSVSRSALVFVLLPVLIIAWLERRKLVLVLSGLGLLIAYSLVTQARNFIFIVVDGKTGAVTGNGLWGILSDLLIDSNLIDFSFLFKIFTSILRRVEGFNNLVMAHYYDPNAVMNSAGFILRIIWSRLAPIDLDLHHLEWQGNVLPDGFVNGGALLSNMIIISNSNFLWTIITAIVTACILLVLERSIQRIMRKYEIKVELGMFVIGFLTILFFISPGSVVFVFPLFIAIIFSLLPRLSIRSFFTPYKQQSDG